MEGGYTRPHLPNWREMLVDNFAKQLRFDLGIETGITQDDQGSYHLTLSQIPVIIAHYEEGFALLSAIGKVPQSPSNEEFFVTLMLANLMGQGTGGAILSLDETTHSLHLGDKVPYEVTYVEFKDHLETFFNYAQYWRKKLQEACR